MSRSSDLAGPGSAGRHGVTSLLTPLCLSHPHQPLRGGSRLCPPPQPLPHLPTSFRSVLILSLASSIRLASMKSLYLSESGTWWGQGQAEGSGHPLGPGTPMHQPEMLGRGLGVLLGSPWDRAQRGREGQRTRAGPGDSVKRGSAEPPTSGGHWLALS